MPHAQRYMLGRPLRACISEHHRRVPLQSGQLRPLHRRLPDRRAERVLIQRQNVRRQRHRIITRYKVSRPERRVLRQFLRELLIPWADGLGDVSV